MKSDNECDIESAIYNMSGRVVLDIYKIEAKARYCTSDTIACVLACAASEQTPVVSHKFVFWNPVEYFIICT